MNTKLKEKHLVDGVIKERLPFNCTGKVIIKNISKTLLMLKSYRLQLDHLGYYVENGYIKYKRDYYNFINSLIKVSTNSNRQRQIASDRCYLAYKTDFKVWSTLKTYEDQAIKINKGLATNHNKCVYVATFVKILNKLK